MIAAFVLSHSATAKEAKPDRVVSITSLERYEKDTPGKAYKVEARTSGSEPTLYYKLLCGTGAANLNVGSLYQAEELNSKEGVKILLIFDAKSEDDPKNVIGLGCDVQSVNVEPKR
jgi:hypothetical protein